MSVGQSSNEGWALVYFNKEVDAIHMVELLKFLKENKIDYPPEMDSIEPLTGSIFHTKFNKTKNTG